MQVIRLNQAPTAGYSSAVGTKTSFRILNPTWQSRYGDTQLVSQQAANELLALPSGRRRSVRRRRLLQSAYRSNATRPEARDKPTGSTTAATTHLFAKMVDHAVPAVPQRTRTRPSAGEVRSRHAEEASVPRASGAAGVAGRHDALLAKARSRHSGNQQRTQEAESERTRHQVGAFPLAPAGYSATETMQSQASNGKVTPLVGAFCRTNYRACVVRRGRLRRAARTRGSRSSRRRCGWGTCRFRRRPT